MLKTIISFSLLNWKLCMCTPVIRKLNQLKNNAIFTGKSERDASVAFT